MLIRMGGEAFCVPLLLRFLTDAVIHDARGRLLHVKYRAWPTLSFDLAGGPSELWLGKCFVRVCVFNF